VVETDCMVSGCSSSSSAFSTDDFLRSLDPLVAFGPVCLSAETFPGMGQVLVSRPLLVQFSRNENERGTDRIPHHGQCLFHSCRSPILHGVTFADA
jgi:hypothetical protein